MQDSLTQAALQAKIGRPHLGFLDRPRRHLHRHCRRASRTARWWRTSCCPRTPRPIATPLCRASATCSAWRPREPIPAGADRRGENGHHRRDQCAARTQGRTHAADHHQGFPRRPAASATRRGRTSSPRRSSSRRCCSSAWSRSTNACAPTARSSRRPISRPSRPILRRAHRPTAFDGRGDRVHARLSLSGARATSRGAGAATWASRRCRSATRYRRSIKLVGRGDTTVVDAYLSPILRSYVEQVAGAVHRTRLTAPRVRIDDPAERSDLPPARSQSCGDLPSTGEGARLMFMMSSGGLTAANLFQGKDAILSGPGRRRSRHGGDRARSRLRPCHRI